MRHNYLLWAEGRGPSVVIEVTSSRTRHEDTRRKFEVYRDVLRVPEYFLFDPFGDYLTPPFQGFRLAGGEYRPMRMKDDRLRSRQLELDLVADGRQLRVVNPATGERLPTRAEARRVETQARQAAEAEVERLRAELAAVRERGAGRDGR